MTDEIPPLQGFFEIPNDLLMDEPVLEYEMECGLFADRVPSLTERFIVVGAMERLSYAETLDEYRGRREELTEAYALKKQRGPNEVIYTDDDDEKQPSDRRDAWYEMDGQTTYYEDGAERIDNVLGRDIYLYERHWFEEPVESVSDLAQELSRLTGQDLTADDLW